jgi:hypothetical protein
VSLPLRHQSHDALSGVMGDHFSLRWRLSRRRENSASGIPGSQAGYHSDRMAFYLIADMMRLYAAEGIVKVKSPRCRFDLSATS